MGTFEAKVVPLKGNAADMEKMLNQLGAERWELVAVESPLAFLRRSAAPVPAVTVINNHSNHSGAPKKK